jgi:hypothetical protein
MLPVNTESSYILQLKGDISLEIRGINQRITYKTDDKFIRKATRNNQTQKLEILWYENKNSEEIEDYFATQLEDIFESLDEQEKTFIEVEPILFDYPEFSDIETTQNGDKIRHNLRISFEKKENLEELIELLKNIYLEKQEYFNRTDNLEKLKNFVIVKLID